MKLQQVFGWLTSHAGIKKILSWLILSWTGMGSYDSAALCVWCGHCYFYHWLCPYYWVPSKRK